MEAGAREIICPEIVMAPPAVRVCEPMMKAEEGFCVMVEDPIIITGVVFGFSVGVVVCTGSVAWSLWVMVAEAESGMIVVLPTTITGSVGADAGTAAVVEAAGAGLKTMAPPDAAAETCCPLTVIAEPGKRVCAPNMKFEEASWVIVSEPKTMAPAGGLSLLVGTGDAVIGAVGADPDPVGCDTGDGSVVVNWSVFVGRFTDCDGWVIGRASVVVGTAPETVGCSTMGDVVVGT